MIPSCFMLRTFTRTTLVLLLSVNILVSHGASSNKPPNSKQQSTGPISFILSELSDAYVRLKEYANNQAAAHVTKDTKSDDPFSEKYDKENRIEQRDDRMHEDDDDTEPEISPGLERSGKATDELSDVIRKPDVAHNEERKIEKSDKKPQQQQQPHQPEPAKGGMNTQSNDISLKDALMYLAKLGKLAQQGQQQQQQQQGQHPQQHPQPQQQPQHHNTKDDSQLQKSGINEAAIERDGRMEDYGTYDYDPSYPELVPELERYSKNTNDQESKQDGNKKETETKTKPNDDNSPSNAGSNDISLKDALMYLVNLGKQRKKKKVPTATLR